MKRICVFDVNETLLDLQALDPYFKKIFGDATIRKQWFGQFIQSALVATITDVYTPFGKIGLAALDMIAQRQNVHISEEDKTTILQGMVLDPLIEKPDIVGIDLKEVIDQIILKDTP